MAAVWGGEEETGSRGPVSSGANPDCLPAGGPCSEPQTQPLPCEPPAVLSLEGGCAAGLGSWRARGRPRLLQRPLGRLCSPRLRVVSAPAVLGDFSPVSAVLKPAKTVRLS